jgi:hypothetical protein
VIAKQISKTYRRNHITAFCGGVILKNKHRYDMLCSHESNFR